MKILKMILLTKSSKYGSYCVAGIDCASGNWVRLMSANPETSGALDNEMMYDACKMRYAEVLDQVLVDVSEPRPTIVQPENILISQKPNMRIVRRASLQDVLEIHPHDQYSCIFGSNHHVVQVDAKSLGHSLELIDATDLKLYGVVNSSGSTKCKLDFSYRGKLYSRFSVTDPDYYGRSPLEIPHATLVLSIADNEWSRQNGYYIYVAKIFDGRDYCNGSRGSQRSMAAPQLVVSQPSGTYASKVSTVAQQSKRKHPITPMPKHSSGTPRMVVPPIAATVKPISTPHVTAQEGLPAAAAAVKPVSTRRLSTNETKPDVVVPATATAIKPPESPQFHTAAPTTNAVAPTAVVPVKPKESQRPGTLLPNATFPDIAQAGSQLISASEPEVSALTRPSKQPIPQSSKHHRKRRFLFLLLAAVFALIIVLTVANGTSYIAPYSGKRYHSTKFCRGLRNAQSVVERPTLWLTLYMKPCGYCCK